jgi:hypothetical protein
MRNSTEEKYTDEDLHQVKMKAHLSGFSMGLATAVSLFILIVP